MEEAETLSEELTEATHALLERTRDALADILAPIGLTAVALKAEGRYVEDVY